MRAAVYCGTRNLYQHMVTAAKSLLRYSNVEKIYFLIQDDVFPYQLPQIFECINVSDQQYFKRNGPNYNNKWTYMAMIKAALPKIFPNLDEILSLDVDTIINDNISDLWDIDLTNYYIAGVREPNKTKDNFLYVNAGVLLINLKKMRQDKIDDLIINVLNTISFGFPEQDAFNLLCQSKIYELSPNYNVNMCAEIQQIYNLKIIHYAIINEKIWSNYTLVLQYKNIDFKNIQRNTSNQFKIDIIIPTYNDKDALRKTLSSINQELLDYYTVNVVDDCSNQDYTDIINDFPFINLYKLLQNSGPGIARQYVLEHTNEPYILFIDSGDMFISNDLQKDMIQTIIKHPQIFIFSWTHYHQQSDHFVNDTHNNIHARIYRRDIIKKYGVSFSKKGSYINQDIGFNRILRIILSDYNQDQIYFYSLLPLINRCYNENSITQRENNAFSYRDQNLGLAYNQQHLFKILQLNNINQEKKQREADQVMVAMYENVYKTSQERPEFIQNSWNGAKYFYDNVYYKYEKTKSIYFNHALSNFLKNKKSTWQKKIPININRFLQDISTYSEVPDFYK